MASIKRDIKYLNRDFSEFRSKLIDFSQTYFPNTYNDFSPSSLGIMFIEQAAYVGDVLNFYLDNQIQENFIQFARQKNNIYELAYMFGYKPKTTGVAQVDIDVYQQLPAITSGSSVLPDYTYSVTLPQNSQVVSTAGDAFLIEDKVDFSVSSSSSPTEVTVYQVSSNQPEYFLLKKTVKAISSRIKTTTFTFGSPSPFQTVNISDSNIVKILDVVDSDNNIWYEVDHLAQEMVYDSIKNTNENDPNNNLNSGEVPYLLRLKKVQRRFATRFISENLLQLQFGVGDSSNNDEEITPNSNNVGLGLPFNQNKLTEAYSPLNFLFTNTYGISPSNTTLTVRYLVGGGVSSNVAANTLTTLSTSTQFNNNNLNPTLANYIQNSISVNNPLAARGGKGPDTLEEIRQNTLAKIASQNRSVTAEDYLIRALSMPSIYGSVSKAYIEKPKLTDNQVSTIETLNLWILTKNSQNYLVSSNNTVKKNLRTYLSQNRIIGDSIEIRDAFVINIGVEFEIIVLPEFNNNDILINCIGEIQTYFDIDNWQINQPILLRDLYVLLDRVRGVQTVKNIKILNKAGFTSGYSEYEYDIEAATLNQVVYPSLDPSIFEIRYPNRDIKGKVVPL